MRLQNYLNQKPMFYAEIDYKRAPRAFESIKNSLILNSKIVHLVGTNAKGSTGRFLAYYLHRAGYSVGHYSSPHIVDFNERIWIDGKNISDEKLESAHDRLQLLLNEEFKKSLSYFEYTTFLALVAFENLDFIIFEAGLGGEYDATSVVESDLTLVTPIDFDHMDFLGDTIEQIATTKLKATKQKAIIGEQSHSEVFNIAKELELDFKSYQEYIDKELKYQIEDFISKKNLPKFFTQNLSLAVASLIELNLFDNLSKIEDIQIFGRFYKLSENITIDVGHNPLSARAIANSLGEKKVNLIYNTYSDKNYTLILDILKDNIKKLYLIDFENQRLEDAESIFRVCRELKIEYEKLKKIENSKEYLVYGSFSTIEQFLKGFHFER